MSKAKFSSASIRGKIFKVSPEQIEVWVDSHFEYKHASGGKQFRICNPFDDDTDFHLWISAKPVKNKRGQVGYYVHDFRPGNDSINGSFFRFVSKYLGVSYFDAIREVVGSTGDAREVLRGLRASKTEDEKDEDGKPEEILLELPPGSKSFEKSGGTAREIAEKYLRSRKITVEEAVKNNLHYTSTTIVFPYIEYGILVYWQERSILGKIFNFPNEEKTGLRKTDYLYGFDDVEPHEHAIIVEAIVDKLTIGAGSVAIGGATIDTKQIRKLRAANPELIILAPDNDEAGVKSLKQNYDLIKHYFKVGYCIPPNNEWDLKDWNDFDKKFGPGWSKEYITENSRKVKLADALKPWIGKV
jgi:hypothetical protein